MGITTLAVGLAVAVNTKLIYGVIVGFSIPVAAGLIVRITSIINNYMGLKETHVLGIVFLSLIAGLLLAITFSQSHVGVNNE